MKKHFKKTLLWMLSVLMLCGTFLTTGAAVITADAAPTDSIPAAQSVKSAFDYLSTSNDSIVVKGWVFYTNDTSRTVIVHVFIGGDANDPYAEHHYLAANVSRSDVDKVYHCGANHGYEGRIHTDKLGTQPVYLYAADESNDDLIGTQLAAKTVTLYGSVQTTAESDAAVIANAANVTTSHTNIDCCVDQVTSGKGSVTIKGWAFDRDDISQSLWIHVYVGGAAGNTNTELHIIKADAYRPDVNKAYGCGDYHGFSATLLTNRSGDVPVYIYAINVGAGSFNPCIGGYTATIHSQTEGFESALDCKVINASPEGFRILMDFSDYENATGVTFKAHGASSNYEQALSYPGTVVGKTAYADILCADLGNETPFYVYFAVHDKNNDPVYMPGNPGRIAGCAIPAGTLDNTVVHITTQYTFNGHLYSFCTYSMSWTEAQKWCTKQGGYLATVNSAEEWDAIKCLLSANNAPCCWLGGQKVNGNWQWVSGEPFTFTAWGKNQPDNVGGKENYLGTYEGSLLNNYSWNDFEESHSYVGCFIIEQPCSFVVNYDLNGGSGHVENQIKSKDVPVLLTAEVPTKEHSRFIGWSTDKNATEAEYPAGGLYEADADVTLYAVWEVSHDYTEAIISPTCTEGGFTLHQCKYCDDSYKDEFTQPYGHSFIETVVPPTAEEDGYTLHTCQLCGYSYQDNFCPFMQNTSTLSAEAIKVGTSLTVNASVSGGTAPYTYTVMYKKASAGKWTTKQNKNANDTITIKPNAAVPYDILVQAYDSNGMMVEKTFTVTVFANLKNESELSAESIGLGETVTAYAKSSGGLGDVTYAAYYKKATSEKWSAIQKYSDNSVITFKPSAAVAYDVMVKVKDSRGVVVNKTFTVNVVKLTNNSTIDSNEIYFGQTIDIACSAMGGSAPYQFAVLYKKTTSEKWTVKQNYSDNVLVSIAPGAKATYDICVKARDSVGHIAKVSFTVKVMR